MKKARLVSFILLLLTATFFYWLGIGFYSSSSAVSDLTAALESIYGTEYTEKETENGIESMEFMIKPKTWFLTNWNLRNILGLDYHYECQVIFTIQTKENTTILQTITYHAVDPMGTENTTVRAHLDPESMSESTLVK